MQVTEIISPFIVPFILIIVCFIALTWWFWLPPIARTYGRSVGFWLIAAVVFFVLIILAYSDQAATFVSLSLLALFVLIGATSSIWVAWIIVKLTSRKAQRLGWVGVLTVLLAAWGGYDLMMRFVRLIQ